MPESEPVHVAVGVVFDSQGKVLISKRAEHLHQGGLWEFPGGKLEAGETVQQALARELQEELAIRITSLHPLIRIPYHYPDRHVLLDVWAVTSFTGTARGMEGQPVEWVEPSRLIDYTFPAANKPIVTAARLPDKYLISGAFYDLADFKRRLERSLQQGLRLVQLRAKQLTVKQQHAV